MPASPLAAALLGGNEANALGLDPNALQANADIQLGQGMQTAGLSTAPAYAPQALARLAQAISGTYLRESGISDLGKAISGGIEGMKDVFPEDTMIGRGLRSPSPLVRAITFQQIPKVMTLNSEGFNLERGGQHFPLGGGTAPSAANTNPMSPEGAAIADAQRLNAQGQPAAANAVTSAAVSKPAQIGESGTIAPPVQLNIPRVPRGAGAAPSAAIQPPPTADEMATAKDRLAQKLNNANAAGVTNPSATAMPTQPTANPESIAAAKGTQAAQEKLYGGASEALGKSIGEQIEAGGKNARVQVNALNTIEDALKEGGKGVVTGPFAEKVLRGKEALDSLGVDTSWIKKGLAESEVVSKMNAQLASASAKAMTGRPTQFEFSAWMKNNPGLLTSKEGTIALINVLRQSAQQDIALGKLAQNKANWDHWGDVTEKFYKEHPLISPFTNKPLGVEAAAAPAAPANGGWAVRRIQ